MINGVSFHLPRRLSNAAMCHLCKVLGNQRTVFQYFDCICIFKFAFCIRYMDPLTKGEYPKSMRSMAGDRLPKFSKEESHQLKGSFDFLGLNYYSSFYAAYAPHLRDTTKPAQQTDALVNVTSNY